MAQSSGDNRTIGVKIECDAKQAAADLNDVAEAAKLATEALNAFKAALDRLGHAAATSTPAPSQDGVWAQDITGNRTFIPIPAAKSAA